MAEEEKDPDVVRVKDLAAMIGTHFDDFILIVRTSDGMAWKHSDPTWGMGAATRYMATINNGDLAGQIESRMGDEE